MDIKFWFGGHMFRFGVFNVEVYWIQSFGLVDTMFIFVRYDD